MLNFVFNSVNCSRRTRKLLSPTDSVSVVLFVVDVVTLGNLNTEK